jgi:hypothetical protein
MYSCTPEGVIMVAMKEAEKKVLSSLFSEKESGAVLCVLRFPLLTKRQITT